MIVGEPHARMYLRLHDHVFPSIYIRYLWTIKEDVNNAVCRHAKHAFQTYVNSPLCFEPKLESLDRAPRILHGKLAMHWVQL